MDHLARLIVAVLLALVAGNAAAHGEVPEKSGVNWTCISGTYSLSASSLSYEGACAAVAAQFPPTAAGGAGQTKYYTYSMGACGLNAGQTMAGSCTVNYSMSCKNEGGGSCGTSSGSYPLNFSGVVTVSCPQYSSGTSGQCFCQAGFKPDGSSCVAIGDCTGAAQAANDFEAATGRTIQIVDGGGVSSSACMGGCVVNGSVGFANGQGQRWVGGPFSAAGTYCNGIGNTGENTTPAPMKCGANQCPGVVNGANVCVACTTSQNGASSSASPASGASGSSANLDGVSGASSKDTAYSCSNGTCTTTTTYKDGSGQVVQTKTDAKDQGSFCAENPGLQICKNSAISASCASFSCDGDAIQCALTRKVYESSCKWEQGDPRLNALGDAALSGGTRPQGHPANDPSVVPIDFASSIDMTDSIGAGGCPADQAFAFRGSSLVIPWSAMCSPLQMVGSVFVAVCLLASAFIVFRN